MSRKKKQNSYAPITHEDDFAIAYITTVLEREAKSKPKVKDAFAHLRDVVAEHDGLGIGEPATYFSPMDNEVIITDPEYGIVAISTADIKEVVDSDEDDDVVYTAAFLS